MCSHKIYIFSMFLLFTVPISLSSCIFNKSDVASQKDGGLFIEAAKSGTLPTKEGPTIIRTRYVEINLDQLDNAEVGDVITLNLFEDAVFEFVIETKVSNNDGSYSITGSFKEEETSYVTIVLGGGQMVGNIVLTDALYQVRYIGDNVYAIHQIDQSGFPSEAEPITPN